MERIQILEGLKEIFRTIRPSIETRFNFKFDGMPVLNTVGDVIDFIGEQTK